MSAANENIEPLLPKSSKKDNRLSEWDISKSWKTVGKSFLWLIRAIIDQRFIVYGALVPIFLGAQLTAVKVVTSITSFHLLLYRSIVYLPALLFIKFDDVTTCNASDWMLSVLCGILNAAALVLAYEAVEFAHLGNVSCIITNQPIPAAILSSFFFGEPFKMADLFLILLNFTGILLVSKPPIIFDAEQVIDYQREFIGAIVALVSVVCYVFASLVTKLLNNRGKCYTAIVVLLMGVAGIIAALLQMALTNNFDLLPRFDESMLIACVAFSSLFGSACVIWALHEISFLLLSIFFTLCAPIAYVFGCVFLGEVPDLISISGTVLIIGSSFGFLAKTAMSPATRELD